MAITTESIPQLQTPPIAGVRPGVQAPSTAGFDLRMMLASLWLIAGESADAAAHQRHAVDSFFTPWHALFYSGVMVCAFVIFWQVWRNQAKGYTLWKAVPRGYHVAAIGVVFLGVGGVFDLYWHSVYGIEFNLAALFSPSHFLLIAAVGMVLSSTISSIWWRRQTPFTSWRTDWRDYLPLIFGLMMLSLYTATITSGFQPISSNAGSLQAITDAGGNSDISVLIGMPSIIIQVFLMMSILLMALRRFRLLPGTIFLLVAIPNVLVALIADNLNFVPTALIAALLVELLVQRLQPDPLRPLTYRLTAFLIPLIYYVVYFATLLIQNQMGWGMEFWAGAIVISGGVGVIISYLIVPAPSLIVVQAE